MQMQYLICPSGSEHAGTRTMILTTGGGGYFGKQSGSATPPCIGAPCIGKEWAEARKGDAITAPTQRPKSKRVNEIFMAETGSRAARGMGFPIIKGAGRVVLSKSGKS